MKNVKHIAVILLLISGLSGMAQETTRKAKEAEGYVISDIFDVTFKPDGLTRTTYNTMLGANLKNAHSDDSQRLPIPATFIIDTNSKIIWRQFDPNYKNRSTVSDIINNIK